MQLFLVARTLASITSRVIERGTLAFAQWLGLNDSRSTMENLMTDAAQIANRHIAIWNETNPARREYRFWISTETQALLTSTLS